MLIGSAHENRQSALHARRGAGARGQHPAAGGVRRCILDDGRSKGVTAFEVDTGAGFRFTVLPDRGLDISSASFRGTNLVHLTQNGEAHPAFYEPQGLGWLRTFFAGLLTTCGLTYLGPRVGW